METVTGLFRSLQEAQRAIAALRENGIAEDRVSYLAPGDPLPHAETDSPVTPAREGAMIGAALGAGAATFLIPGLGPLIGAGLLGGALAGGALGAAAGKVVDRYTHGVPNEDLWFYEEVLRHGGTVVLVQTDDADEAVRVRNLMERSGARGTEALRREWWMSMRDRHADFAGSERDYAAGFEAALHPATRGRDYDEVMAYLEQCYPEPCRTEAFRVGYARGQEHFRTTRGGGTETL